MSKAPTAVRSVNIPPYTLQLTVAPSRRVPSLRELISGMKDAGKGWFYIKISDYKDEAAARSSAYVVAQALSCRVTTSVTTDKQYVEVRYAGRTRITRSTPPVPSPS